MKKLFFIVNMFFSVCAFAQIDKVLPAPQNPPKLYNDFTKGKNFLTPEQVQALEGKLEIYDDSTSNQIAIVIVEDLHGYDANTFATQLGRKWGVGGQKQFNNGIVILISTGGGKGNRDAYIAIGYGLEGAIPDMVAASIVDHAIIDNFKEGNFYRGLDEAVDAIIKAAGGEYTAPSGYGDKSNLPKIGKLIGVIIFIIVMIIISANRNNKGGGYASRRGYRGLGGPFWWGTGSGWSGGGSGGGWSGGGGGGFGGFGGGSFGGGGAGGKW